MSASRAYDVVVWGATGFTGKLVAEYLVRNYTGRARFAIAGRNAAKLETVRAALAAKLPSASSVDIVTASITDAPSLRAMAASTKVVLTTVGPFDKVRAIAFRRAAATR